MLVSVGRAVCPRESVNALQTAYKARFPSMDGNYSLRVKCEYCFSLHSLLGLRAYLQVLFPSSEISM